MVSSINGSEEREGKKHTNVHILTMSHFTWLEKPFQNQIESRTNNRLLPKIEIIHKNDGFLKISNTADFRSKHQNAHTNIKI